MALFSMLAAAALAMAAQAAPPPGPVYAEGQVWEYRTRPGEEGSRLKIQKIETVPGFEARGPVYHVSVTGVRLGPRIAPMLPHLPVSRQTLDASVTRRSEEEIAALPFEEGIAEWRRAEGGVYTISVAEIVATAEQSLAKAALPE
jgi:hypothetical protein